jgi:glycosyltransferase involved in cell wall biosynthesis
MMGKALHILFLTNTLEIGGTERQITMLAVELARRGWRVSLCALDGRGPLRERLVAGDVTVVDGGYRPGTGSNLAQAFALLRAQLRIVSTILMRRPLVLHAFLPLGNFMGVLAGLVTRVPLIVTSRRNLGTYQDRRPFLKWMDHVANGFSHVVTANSQAIADDTERRNGYPAARIVVIPNGLDFGRYGAARDRRDDMRRALELGRDETGTAFVANLIPYKGHAELIAAWANVVQALPGAKLFLIGQDRGIGASLMHQVAELGLEARVVFLGRRDDVPDLIGAMDAGVMASHEEGFSNALLEKLAAGLPVVATDVGGNPAALA